MKGTHLDARPRERPVLAPVLGRRPMSAAHEVCGEGRANEVEELDGLAILILLCQVEWGLPVLVLGLAIHPSPLVDQDANRHVLAVPRRVVEHGLHTPHRPHVGVWRGGERARAHVRWWWWC